MKKLIDQHQEPNKEGELETVNVFDGMGCAICLDSLDRLTITLVIKNKRVKFCSLDCVEKIKDRHGAI